MTEIQRTNIQVCNQIIAQLGQDKPFVLKLNSEQGKIFWSLMNEQKVYGIHLPVVRNDSGYLIEVSESNADVLYHMLASYIEKHDLPEAVVQRLGEVS